ncbi:hypothetical protein [Pseudoalteromonas aurantia]|uniref:Lipid/polyisoprenoid-binding YceI-like domain-containing protein n=1 Tax=Pseudoalteromonas aurantia 208 TaxID=1314867 RepID=A0ABR9EGD8_9GAMM|nr:hypothetical protein [Pseudoalteromonas aurantia]MBE0369892.1 hypothetical protein [Pseudoalteromonas aurantia 208]
MKWFMVLVSVFMCTQTVAVDKWRGLLEIQPHVFLTIGFNVDPVQNKMTLDSPNQGKFGKSPTEYTVSDSVISFKDTDLQAEFKGRIEGNTLVGSFIQGQTMPLTLHKLSEQDLKQLKYEGAYQGELDINGKPLPVIVQVAVTKEGFYSSLDSPAQQSFGIPLNKFTIDNQKMTFSSKMIGAQFSGKLGKEGYQGKFVQGFEMPLTLKKKRL